MGCCILWVAGGILLYLIYDWYGSSLRAQEIESKRARLRLICSLQYTKELLSHSLTRASSVSGSG